MKPDAPDADEFLALVAKARAANPALNDIQAGLIVAEQMGIAGDSRTFSRLFDISHALVLRELTLLAQREAIAIIKRDARTLRTYYSSRHSATS